MSARGPEDGNPASDHGSDLLGTLAARLAEKSPALVLVYGEPGSGKSSLVRALVQRVEGPTLFVAYRILSPGPGASGAGAPPTQVELLLLDPDRAVADGLAQQAPTEAIPVSFAPTGAQTEGPRVPPQLAAAVEAMASAGGGTLFVDSWDRRSEEAYRALSGLKTGGIEVTASIAPLQEQLGRIPVHTVIAMLGRPEPSADSLADVALILGREEIDGSPAHVLHVEKSAVPVPGPDQMLFSTEHGGFFCPPPQEAPPIRGVPAPDPEIEAHPGSYWPGSAEYARAFGRLRFNGYTVLELLDEAPSAISGALGFPMIAWTLLRGGRVVWVPSPMLSHGRILRILAGVVPPDQIRQNLRILSASSAESTLGEMRAVALPVRKAQHGEGELRTADAPPVEPMFPDAYQFLKGRSGDGLSLFVLALDGLRALSATSGNAYDPATFPLLVERYARIEHFHGLGIVRGDDALARGVLPTADTWLRIRQRHGQTVITGVRPKTPAYLMDWEGTLERYTLHALS